MPQASPKAVRPAYVGVVTDAQSARVVHCDCNFQLTFMRAMVGGVEPLERWERYVCRRCGMAFKYRSRTGMLTREL